MTRVRFLSVFASLLFLTATAFGQATTSLRGTVTDPQGGIIGGAVLDLVNEETGFKRAW